MAKTSLSILKQKLQNYGWKLQEGQIIDDKEYDCIGWQAKKNDFQHIDLAIEMYFPLPKELWLAGGRKVSCAGRRL